MSGQFDILGMKAAQVHQPAHAGPLCRVDDVVGRLPLLGDEILRRTHRMHQVVDDVDAFERLDKRFGLGEVAPCHLHVIAPRRVGKLVRVARERPHPQARIQ